MTKRFILFLIFMQVGFFVFCQSKISGKAAFAPSQTMRINTYDDLISYKITTIKTVEIDKTGNFEFELNFRSPVYLFFEINFINGQVLIEPDKNYKLEFSVDSIYTNPTEITVSEVPMWVEILEPKSNNLMSFVVDVEETIENFLSSDNNFSKIYYARSVETLQLLKTILDQKFGYINNPYFKIYMHYRFAQVDFIQRSKMTTELYADYLTDIEIYYNNLAYMQFFNEFFTRYIQSANSNIPKNKLDELINETGNYFELLDYLGKDPLLVNEMIRELVLIKNLSEMYNIIGTNQSNIILLLLKLAETTKFEEHRKIANNMIEFLVKQSVGNIPVAKNLKDLSGNTISIDKYRGKPLYIQFFSVDCSDCIAEMFAIQKVKKDFEGKIEFISVSMDINTTKLYHFVNRFPQFDWPILSFGNNYEWVKSFDIHAFPAQVLLDAEGKIIQYPAMLASEELSRFLYAYFMEDYRPKPVYIPGMSGERPKPQQE
ncbi:MAG: TlpA disulfide reductase family protein [Bacteroidales bacterium]|nr:TlpA disulfide reductase family protein [Bacteroidales bacterium]